MTRYLLAIALLARFAAFGIICNCQVVAQELPVASVVQEAVEAGVQLLMEPRTAWAGYNELLLLPVDAVTPVVVETVLSKEAKDKPDPACRGFAYKLLSDLSAEKLDIGFEAFLAGIDDPAGRIISYAALGRIQGSRAARAAERLCDELQRHDQTDWQRNTLSEVQRRELDAVSKATLLRALARLGTMDAAATNEAIATLLDPEATRQVRGAAAQAIVFSGATVHQLQNIAYGPVDDGKDIALLDAFRKLATRSHRVSTPVDVKEEMQKITIDMLRHPNVAVRRQALKVVLPIFGKESILATPSGGRTVNPSFQGALEGVRDSDVSAEMRDGAGQLIDYLEKMRS